MYEACCRSHLRLLKDPYKIRSSSYTFKANVYVWGSLSSCCRLWGRNGRKLSPTKVNAIQNLKDDCKSLIVCVCFWVLLSFIDFGSHILLIVCIGFWVIVFFVDFGSHVLLMSFFMVGLRKFQSFFSLMCIEM